MGKAGCWMISWGIESGNEAVLKKAAKGANPAKAKRALTWARNAGIKNWGYFIVGLPGETVETIRETIDLSKGLPLELALFHVAAPYPGTPFFFEVVKNGWFKPGTKWEEVDMDKGTVLQYDNLIRGRPALLAAQGVPRMGVPPRPGLDLSEDAVQRCRDAQADLARRCGAPQLGVRVRARAGGVRDDIPSVFSRSGEGEFLAWRFWTWRL